MGKIKEIKSNLKLVKVIVEKYEKQTAKGYLIRCSDGEFFVDEDCFKFSDFLYEQIQGKSLSMNEVATGKIQSYPHLMTLKLGQNSKEKRITFLISQHLECKQLEKSLI